MYITACVCSLHYKQDLFFPEFCSFTFHHYCWILYYWFCNVCNCHVVTFNLVLMYSDFAGITLVHVCVCVCARTHTHTHTCAQNCRMSSKHMCAHLLSTEIITFTFSFHVHHAAVWTWYSYLICMYIEGLT